ncbi:unnamed protein product [Pipistrellus nathusii]|uniref:Uncharacterized protein n=1 Tax=Pipistrellus nathusii TaxID=59473 RepID=A0ABN9ZA04_PIPNA
MLCSFQFNTSVSRLTTHMGASWWSSNEFLQCIEVVLCLAIISTALQKLHKCVTKNTTELPLSSCPLGLGLTLSEEKFQLDLVLLIYALID